MANSAAPNPYAAPASDVESAPVGGGHSEAVAVRRAHIRHEASLKGLGALWLLGGLIAVGGAVVPGATRSSGTLGTAVVSAVIGAGAFFCGLDVRRLVPRARITGSIVAVLTLFGFPMGTLIGIYALYLLHGRKGKVVLGPDYARIRELSPEVTYRTSVVVWIALALLIGAFLFVGIASFFGSR